MIERLQTSRAAVDESVRAQRQLVADASHELRTPVTSLRTNIEVLLAGGELEPEDRRRLLADVVEQSEELSALVNDLIELARGDEPGFATEDVRLDRVAAESVARARRNAPGIRFDAQRSPPRSSTGVPERLDRAINNLLDNAARHSPPGGRSSCASTRRAFRSAITAPASTNKICRMCSTASSAGLTPVAARAAASGWRSSGR